MEQSRPISPCVQDFLRHENRDIDYTLEVLRQQASPYKEPGMGSRDDY